MSTTLHLAARIGDEAETARLLENGADANAKNEGLTPLMVAAGHGQETIVTMLLARGADPNILEDHMHISALQIGAQGGNVGVAKSLIEHGAPINLQAPSHGFTPLMNAVWHRHHDLTAYLLSLPNINTELTSALGFKARDLIGELRTGDDVAPQTAERHKAEAERFEALFDTYEKTRAQAFSDQRIMTAVIDETPQEAEKRLESVQAAIATGAEVDAIWPVASNGNDAHTPILVAARDGYPNIVAALLAAGADPTIGCGYMDANPAHKAAYRGQVEVMRVLAAHPTFHSIRDARGPYNGYTPLMDAVWHGHVGTAQVLIDADANTEIVGHDGMTARDLARRFDYQSILDLMENAAPHSSK